MDTHQDRAERRRQLKADAKMMHRALRLIIEPGGVVEIRAIWRGGRIDLGYFDDMDKAVDAAIRLSANLEIKGIYLTLNRLPRDILRARKTASGSESRRGKHQGPQSRTPPLATY
jgi:hypothetical protein